MRVGLDDDVVGVVSDSWQATFTQSEIAEKLCFYILMCGSFKCTESYFKRRDFYPMQLVMCINKGTMYCEHWGKSFAAKEGDIVIMDCEEPHYYQAANGLEFTYIHYTGSNAKEITQYLLNIFGPVIRNSKNYRISSYVNDIISFYKENGDTNIFNASKQVYDLLWMIYEVGNSENEQDEVIKQSIYYMEAHYREKLSIEKIANYVHLSPYYFAHRFKEVTSYSPMEYVIKLRMTAAKNMLIQTDRTIESIAYAVGYNNSNSFGNVFSGKVGCSPSMFRKSMKEA